MAQSTLWWLLAGAAVAVELATGTFYLLMAALGFAAGAIAAHAGGDLSVQLVAAALVGAGAVAALHIRRRQHPAGPAASADPNVNLDVGETVHVEAWDAEGVAQVRYRGATWTVSAAPGTPLQPGRHRVREVVGSRLIVEKA